MVGIRAGTRQRDGDVRRTTGQRPAALQIAGDAAVRIENHLIVRHQLQILIVDIRGLQDDFVIARNIRCIIAARIYRIIGRILKRCRHEPSVLVLEHLVHTDGMTLGAVIRPRVVNQIDTAVIVHQYGVVALCHLPVSLVRPLVVAHQPHTLRTVGIAVGCRRINGIVTALILIRSRDAGRAEHAHIVAAVRSQAAQRHKQVIIPVDVLDIGSLAGDIIAARQLVSLIRIGDICFITICRAVITQPGRLVQLDHPDATEPRAVGHPQSAFLVIDDTGINAVVLVEDVAVGAHIVRITVQVITRLCLASRLIIVKCRSSLFPVIIAGLDHIAHQRPTAIERIRCQHADRRIPVVAVDGHIHTPLAQCRVPDDIRCPHIAAEVVIAAALC